MKLQIWYYKENSLNKNYQTFIPLVLSKKTKKKLNK